MPETPREYKNRIDEQRAKRRRNRDELIEYIQEYELLDENFKTKIRQEILANFEKNENTEKTGELYVKIGEELSSIESKYQELEELKNKLETKIKENDDLKDELNEQVIDGNDETTLKMQMQNVKSIKSKIEKIEGEIDELEKEIEERKNEINEIEKIYGRKEYTDETTIEKEKAKKKPIEKLRKETPKTLQEYREKFLNEKIRTGNIKGKIIELLEEGTGIDESLKEKIKGKISDVFEKHNEEIEGSLRMKSARYMEDRESILNLDASLRIKKNNGKECLMLGTEQYSDWFDSIDLSSIKEVGGKLIFQAQIDGKYCIIRGKEKLGKGFDKIKKLQEIGGKPCFIAQNDGKTHVLRGSEQLGDSFDSIWKDMIKEICGKPVFIARKDGKECVIRGNEQYCERFNDVGYPKEIGGKLCHRVNKDGKECVMLGNKQYSKWFDGISNVQVNGGKPCFEAKKDGKRCVMLGKKQFSNRFDEIIDLQEIGGKPCFHARIDGRDFIMLGDEQQGDLFDHIQDLQEIGGKPCFVAKKEGKRCLMWGNEQYGDWFDSYPNVMKNFEELAKNLNDKSMERTSREEREKVILDRYQKKLNRDELLKIISLSDKIDQETKKTLKTEILNDFFTRFEKSISTKKFQKYDEEYRELKRAERQKVKKSAELEAQKEITKPEVEKLDKKLLEIANSAMNLEDDSRLRIVKSNRLNKAKEDWNTIEIRLNEILDKTRKLHNEEIELIGIYTEKAKKYGEKIERPKIKGIELSKDTVSTEGLGSYNSFKEHKKAYMELFKDKEKYMKALLKQIKTIDFGISEKKKKEILGIIKSKLEKDFETFKEGDEITKLANETEKWLQENWKSVMEQIDELKGKIEEKEIEISEIKPTGKGASSNEIYEAKERQFELKNELLKLKDQYKSIMTELEEKLKKYDGIVIDWTNDLIVETWDEKIERIERIQQEEKERKRMQQERIEREKVNEMLEAYHKMWERELDISDSQKEHIIGESKKIPVNINIEPDGSRLIEIKLGGKKYKILDVNLETESDKGKSDVYKYNRNDRIGVYLGDIGSSDSLYNRNNEKLKEYIRQKKTVGFNIPNRKLQKEILSELNRCSDSDLDESNLLLLWMYLTGLHGCYLLEEGDFVRFGLRKYDFSSENDASGKASIYLISRE